MELRGNEAILTELEVNVSGLQSPYTINEGIIGTFRQAESDRSAIRQEMVSLPKGAHQEALKAQQIGLDMRTGLLRQMVCHYLLTAV